ncbi:heavy metal translocating P-type ATPase [Parasediminibacterium sp. JCM 36343]|uniref:heavy metal translocating P-type ATPase n=1 Tax=Parasediminibacterium sp. JCM 36343 TaxID=3374279 RepID=UPI00397D732B
METINWKVEGMTCSNCALSVNKVLQRQGMQKVQVNAISGEVSFANPNNPDILGIAQKNINDLGYHVVDDSQPIIAKKKKFLGSYLDKFWFCLPFTLVLMAGHWGMALGIHFLHSPWLQLAISLPVMVVGMDFFGRSAIKSLAKGIPNMNVLVALGASAAFVYSLIGTITGDENKIFYETATSILTIVFLGNWLEHYSVQRTQKAINELAKVEKVMANMIAYDDAHNENIFPIENTFLKVGDLVLIKTGEQVPMDCKILSGEADANEAIISGESLPVHKKQGDTLIGGSVLANGTVKCYITATGKDTVMSSIVALMKQAQGQKPPVQLLADKISAVFVPVVVSIALLTIVLNYYLFHQTFEESLMRSIAVLVISCPCAMGLATPAAIAVGLGRAAKHGILYTQPDSMEMFAQIKQIVFDKTGTLTTGEFQIMGFQITNEAIQQVTTYNLPLTTPDFQRIVYSLEKFSNHPVAKSIVKAWKTTDVIKWKKITEIKGLGMQATDKEGNEYMIGSAKIDDSITDKSHQLYVKKNNDIIGWIDIADEIRPESKAIIDFCKQQGMKTILLSGDNLAKCQQVGYALGIDEIIAGQSPQQKLDVIERLCKTTPTVMVGDGINDAPALAKATISISLSAASQLAIQSASVVLMNSGLQKLPAAMQLGRHTYNTVKGNLFWAFFYNIIAIPVAAMGLFTPMAGALLMGLSDVVLAANSLRLNWKRVR